MQNKTNKTGNRSNSNQWVYSGPQQAIIESSAKYVQVIAAAGSGKTRTVIGLVQHVLRNQPDMSGRILLLSFSRRAVKELCSRLDQNLCNKVLVLTFHSFCFRMLARLHIEYKHGFEILEECRKSLFYKKFFHFFGDRVGGIPFALLWKDAERFHSFDADLFYKTKRAFRKYKKANHLKEYSDMVDDMLQLLRSRGQVRENIRNNFQMIIVDEFQDTDPRQLEFLKLIKPERLIVVGDDYQSIYAFRGATPEPFLEFPEIFPGTEVFKLEYNYRSVPAIVELGNKIIKHSSRQIKKRIKSFRKEQFKFPALAAPLASHSEISVVRTLHTTGVEGRVQILTRTNFRRQRWIAVGMPADQVMTIHAAKGLEFPVVILDISSGWSSALNEDPENFSRDEEIRLHYVACSRAQNFLIVLFPRVRGNNLEDWYWRKLYRPFCRMVALGDLDRYFILEQETHFEG